MPKETAEIKQAGEPIEKNEQMEIYRCVYEMQWSDIHHTRDQDWEFSKLILAGFLGLSGLAAFTTSTTLIVSLAVAFILFSVLGILVTTRHKRLFDEKMRAIRILEKHLQVDKLALFDPKKKKGFLGFIKLPSTQDCLILFYILSLVIFATFLLLELKVIL